MADRARMQSGRWVASWVVALLVLTGLSAWVSHPRGAPAAPPANFTDTLIVSGFSTIPTDVTALADSRLLITTQAGVVFTFKSGTLSTALDFSGRTCSNLERGMFGVALDPSFPSNHYVYLSYSFNKFGTCVNNNSQSPVNRVSRFVYSIASNRLDASSETVLLDNMPSPGGGHNVGDLAFANDGTLVISIGDGSCDLADSSRCAAQNTNARKMNLLLGKMLRITSAGGIPSDNPFQGAGTARCNVNGKTSPGTICREIYATGFRNPFRFAIDPNASGIRLHVDDTGQNTWEEVNGVVAGGDYGWSVCEGRFQTGSTSADCSLGAAIDPLFSYGHGECNAVTGSAFVPNGLWPAAYNGAYLFGDYTCDRIWALSKSGNSYTRTDFATGVDLISMAFGPSGSTQALYYTTLGGQVRKIQYTGTVNRPPEAKATATPMFGALPLEVEFDGRTSSDPDNQSLTYDWDFGDGTAHGTSSRVTHTFTTKKIFTVKLTVRDTLGASDSVNLKIDAGNTQPQPVILSPAVSDTFAVGQAITLQGSATDGEDGTLPSSALTWEVIKHHADHTHPFLPPTTGNDIEFDAPDPEDLLAATNSYLEIRLTAVDSNGLKKTVSQNFQPHKVAVTFESEPSGLIVTVEGVNLMTPSEITSWTSWNLDVTAPLTQVDSSGQVVRWGAWSDGGARSHAITTGTGSETFTAVYQQATGPTYAPVADARVREASPNSNYGTSATLEVDGGSDPEIETYLKFNVSGLTGPVEDATLWLFVVNGTVNGPAVYETGVVWGESTITWQNRTAKIGPELDNRRAIANSSWVAYDVSDAVTGNGEVSFALVGASPDGITARSREASSNRPKLVIGAEGTGGDSEAPSVPTGFEAQATAWNRVELSWEASIDNVGVTGYDIFRDGVLLTSTGTDLTFGDMTVVGDTDYQYQVRARDGAGNRSALSEEAAVSTPIRTTTRTFAALADARVQENKPTTRYGSSPELRVEAGTDPDIESYLRFDVSGLTGSVQQATLRVFVPSQTGYGTVDGPAVYGASNSWSESTITWTNRPNRSATAHDDKGAISVGTWVEFDVTSLVTTNGQVTFALAGTSTDVVVFSSREGATPPQLVVVAAVGGGLPSAAAAETPTPTSTPRPARTPRATGTATVTPPSPEPTAIPTDPAPSPTEEPSPTVEPPTSTPLPTETPLPTMTPEPPTPAPTATPEDNNSELSLTPESDEEDGG